MSNDESMITALVARIEAEVARRKAEAGPAAPTSGAAAPFSANAGSGPDATEWPRLPRPSVPHLVIPERDSYSMMELLTAQDADFGDGAFRAILRRPADPASLAHFLGKLRTGELGKVDVLGRLRYSPEGRARGIPISGLLPAFALSHARTVPLVGGVIAFAVALLRLPGLVRAFQRLESHVVARERDVAAESAALVGAIEVSLDSARRAIGAAELRTRDELSAARVQLREEIEALDQGVAALLKKIDAVRDAMACQADLERATERLGAVEQRLADLGVLEQTSREHEARLAAMDTEMVSIARHAEGLVSLVEDQKAEAARALAEAMAHERAGVAALEERIAGLARSVDLERDARDAALAAACDAARAVEGALSARLASLAEALDALPARTERSLEALGGDLRALVADRVDAVGRGVEAALAGASTAAAAAQAGIDSLRAELMRHRGALAALDRRVAGVSASKAAKGGRKPAMPPSRSEAGRLPSHALDAFYADFEDRFRGTRDAIRARAAAYLRFLEPSGAGLPDAPIVDLGSGRGEWLELLRDEGRLASGVDLNEVFVAGCRENGLEVERADALEALRRRAADSLGAITSMHLVEHLPFEALVELVDEAHRVLRPGGVLILETPNPENLLVAALSFYYDPTHRNPLPPLLLEHLVGARGFANVEVVRLADDRGFSPPAPVAPEFPGAQSINFVLSQFSAAPDYAVVARKP